MAITFPLDGTATISTTEYSLVTNSTTLAALTTKCVMELLIDASASAAGDRFVYRIKEKINGGTQVTRYKIDWTGAAPDGSFIFPAFILGDGWDVTVQKIAGTDRAHSWSIREAA